MPCTKISNNIFLSIILKLINKSKAHQAPFFHLFLCNCVGFSDGSGSKIFDPGQVGSNFCCLGRVSHLWFGYGFGKFHLIMLNFSIFYPLGQNKCHWVGSKSTRVRAGSASYLLRVKSIFGSGRVGSGRVRANL